MLKESIWIDIKHTCFTRSPQVNHTTSHLPVCPLATTPFRSWENLCRSSHNCHIQFSPTLPTRRVQNDKKTSERVQGGNRASVKVMVLATSPLLEQLYYITSTLKVNTLFQMYYIQNSTFVKYSTSPNAQPPGLAMQDSYICQIFDRKAANKLQISWKSCISAGAWRNKLGKAGYWNVACQVLEKLRQMFDFEWNFCYNYYRKRERDNLFQRFLNLSYHFVMAHRERTPGVFFLLFKKSKLYTVYIFDILWKSEYNKRGYIYNIKLYYSLEPHKK